MDDIDEVLARYQQELEPGGWTVRVDRGLKQPAREEEHCHMIFAHQLSGEIGFFFPVTWSAVQMREWIDRDLNAEVQLVSEAPSPLRHPGKLAAIRTTSSGWNWDKDTRTQVAGLMVQLRVLTKQEAAWFVKAGVR